MLELWSTRRIEKGYSVMVKWDEVQHFKRKEWKTDPDKISHNTVLCMDRLRVIAGCKIFITVAYDPSGHASNSRHLLPSERKDKVISPINLADAVDFTFEKGLYTPIEQYCLISAIEEFKGIGWYPEHNTPGWHVDLRPHKLVWVYRKTTGYLYGWRSLLNELIPTKFWQGETIR